MARRSVVSKFQYSPRHAASLLSLTVGRFPRLRGRAPGRAELGAKKQAKATGTAQPTTIGAASASGGVRLARQAYGTVQVPIDCHPLLALNPDAYMKAPLAPAYPAANVTGRFTVRLFPDVTMVVVAILREH